MGNKAMKLKKIVTYVLAPIPTMLTIIAINYFIYYVIEKKAGQREAITVTIIITVFLISAIGYALYDTKIKHRGEFVSSFEDRQTAKMMKFLSPKGFGLFIFLFPLLFLVFFYIYKTTLALLLYLICLLVGGLCEQPTKIISFLIYAVSIFFAIGTCVWLWKQMKKMSPEKPKENTKPI
jgi:hypothetical protein